MGGRYSRRLGVVNELRGLLLPTLDADVRAAYVASSSVLDCHRYLAASELTTEDARDELMVLVQAAAEGDFEPLFDRATYRRMGLTLVECSPSGETFPVELPGKTGSLARLLVRPVRSEVSLPYTWPDVVLSALSSRRACRLGQVTRLVPSGVESEHAIPLRDGWIVRPGGTLGVVGERRRRMAKRDGHVRIARQFRVLNLAAEWGLFARTDQVRRSRGRGRPTVLAEVASEWTWPPIAATVPAVVRMWLGILDRLVTDAGGAIICRDTDGAAILSSPEGGKIELASGRVVRVLPWSEVDAMLARFDALDPFGDGSAFWDTKRGTVGRPLHIVSLAPKRYLLARRWGNSWRLEDWTRHALSAEAPPGFGAQDGDRHPDWTRLIAEWALARAVAVAAGGPAPIFEAFWDLFFDHEFPELRRLSAASPKSLDGLPASFGLHPFAPFVEGVVDRSVRPDVVAPVAPDWGTGTDPFSLPWHTPDDCAREVSTDPGDYGAVPLRRLSSKAARWGRPVLDDEDISEIVVDKRLIRRVGRSGALVDAQLADSSAVAADHQVVFSEGDAAGFLVQRALALGPSAYERLTRVSSKTAKRRARGQLPRRSQAAHELRALLAAASASCDLSGCDRPVLRPNARYCSSAHKDRAYRLRRKEREARRLSDYLARTGGR